MTLLEKHAGHNIEIIEHLEDTHYAHYHCHTCKKFITWCSFMTLLHTRYREQYLKDRKYYSFDLNIKYEERLLVKKKIRWLDFDTNTKKWFMDVQNFIKLTLEEKQKLQSYVNTQSMTAWLDNYSAIYYAEYEGTGYEEHAEVYGKYMPYYDAKHIIYPERKRELTPEEQFWKNQWDKYNGYQ